MLFVVFQESVGIARRFPEKQRNKIPDAMVHVVPKRAFATKDEARAFQTAIEKQGSPS